MFNVKKKLQTKLKIITLAYTQQRTAHGRRNIEKRRN